MGVELLSAQSCAAIGAAEELIVSGQKQTCGALLLCTWKIGS